VTNARQAPQLAPSAAGFPAERVILEPEGRDTAPCIALAAAVVGAADPDAVMAVVPADHLIEPEDRFAEIIRRGAAIAAREGALVTFGIRPTRPATGYGYIERGERIDAAVPAAYRVKQFREKPREDVARQFLAASTFSWNSGIFVWTVSAIRAAMQATAPELAASAEAMAAAARAGDRAALDAAFRLAPRTSIDFAVMERANRVVVVDADLAWNDLGSFLTLDSVAPKDPDGNVTVVAGGTRAVLEDTAGSVVYGEGERTLVLFGARDLVLVAVDDVVLVCPKDRADELKQLVQRLRERGLEHLL
jgi:mannose-1-phosphate guanylyltransferase/mannose-6-phosphate isomerase